MLVTAGELMVKGDVIVRATVFGDQIERQNKEKQTCDCGSEESRGLCVSV